LILFNELELTFCLFALIGIPWLFIVDKLDKEKNKNIINDVKLAT
jgi:hypothetical protein